MPDMNAPCLLWFRQDLRLQDNPALSAAIDRGQPVIPLYILDQASEADWAAGGASRWWLHHALKDLSQQLESYGLKLTLRNGSTEKVLEQLIDETGAEAIYWNRRYEPAIIERDKKIKEHFKQKGLDVRSYNSALLFEPWAVENKSGDPYKVFSPFWKMVLTKEIPKPIETKLDHAKPPNSPAQSDTLESWGLLPKINWDNQFSGFWNPSRDGGTVRLNAFIDGALADYSKGRDRPAEDGTSCLSPYLHFGQIGPREVHHALQCRVDLTKGSAKKYFAEIGWREFAHHILYHFPETPEKPLHKQFEKFPWEPHEKLLHAWQKGQTGYPLVDAGMRQLWAIGWMHNRVRMNVGSLLVKHLQQPWQEGARWFWDCLVDADLASNTLGWQWAAGCGADGAPYFRVFNPMLQGDRFDPEGDYVRRWVPELKHMPSEFIYKPWEAPALVLKEADVRLGENYPKPIIEHTLGRDRALSAYEKLKYFTRKDD